MKWIDIEQNTDEWFDLRLKKSTSSNFAKIMDNFGKSFGEPAKKYAQQKALERVTGVRDESNSYFDKNMQRGNDHEPVASDKYEIQEMQFQELSYHIPLPEKSPALFMKIQRTVSHENMKSRERSILFTTGIITRLCSIAI